MVESTPKFRLERLERLLFTDRFEILDACLFSDTPKRPYQPLGEGAVARIVTDQNSPSERAHTFNTCPPTPIVRNGKPRPPLSALKKRRPSSVTVGSKRGRHSLRHTRVL